MWLSSIFCFYHRKCAAECVAITTQCTIDPVSMPTEAAPRIDHVFHDGDMTRALFLSHRRKCLFSSISSISSMRMFSYSREDS